MREDTTLIRLIAECEPIVDIILTHWSDHRHDDDVRQEVRLRLWRNLRERSSDNLALQTINPTAYLIFYIRTLVCRVQYRLQRLDRDCNPLPPEERLQI